MNSPLQGRPFQLWEYRVSHGSLLIRSPKTPEIPGSVDIICLGVQYVAVPRHLGEVSISMATPEEIAEVENILGKRIQLPEQVYILSGRFGRGKIVGVNLIVREHQGDIFESPFNLY